MVRPLRTAVIGCGYWGPNHVRNLHELPEAELAWVCDICQERLDAMRQRYPGVRTTCDYADMLRSDVDAVVIATPVASHARLAMDCLQAGKHVLIEKPIATSSHEAAQIVAEGDRRGLVVMAGHTFEYNPAVEAVRDLIASGDLGEIYYVHGCRANLGLFQPDINVLWDLAPHDISILMFILGADPMTAAAYGASFVQRGLHDVAFLALDFPKEVMASLWVSWLDPCKIRRYTVVGSRKMLVYDDVASDGKVLIYDKGVEIHPTLNGEREFRAHYRRGEGTVYPIRWVEPLKAECQHFLDCIRTGREPRSSGRVAMKVIRVLETAQYSLLNGGMKEEIPWQPWTSPVSPLTSSWVEMSGSLASSTSMAARSAMRAG